MNFELSISRYILFFRKNHLIFDRYQFFFKISRKLLMGVFQNKTVEYISDDEFSISAALLVVVETVTTASLVFLRKESRENFE